MKRFFANFVLYCSSAMAQVNSGELRLRVLDPSGAGVKAAVRLTSSGSGYSNTFATDASGTASVQRLAYGIYLVSIDQPGFVSVAQPVEIHSAIPVDFTVRLQVAPVTTQVTVNNAATLIDPDRTGSVMQIGSKQIEQRLASLPGRSVQDLVNSQPGWLYEGNAVLHPRGSEYQTQFVVDGIPLTDNRSPGLGPEIEADDVDSMKVYTAGVPAEYGRKMGGVVELNTLRDTQAGLHGDAELSGGSFATAGAFARVQYVAGKNTFTASGEGNGTGHYLNPVVPENYTNNGTTGDFSAGYERELTPNDRLNFMVRHAFSRFEIPNEQVQQAVGQRQDGDNFETMGIVAYQHVFSSDVIGNLRGMVREDSNDLFSNPASSPVIAFQQNEFKEGYFKGTISVHHGVQEW